MHNLKVLFVCSGNNQGGISPNVRVQAEGLKNSGVEVDFYEIKGNGIIGYLSNVIPLKKHIDNTDYDVVHAHYGFSGIVATLAGANPLLVTIMGSELYLNRMFRTVVVYFIRNVWDNVIVQSESMKTEVGNNNVIILQNGIDILKFKNVDVQEAKRRTEFNHGKHIVWAASPERREKNFSLAKKAVDLLGEEFTLDAVYGKPHDEMPYYFKAADALLLTSKWEGSPIVVKEALAAGLPVVSVDVGDVKELLENIEGCYVTSESPVDIGNALQMAVEYKNKIEINSVLDRFEISFISERLKDVYRSIK
ncbi:MAG: glycosyltransferase [Chlorobi bacterium]|nr:glycosyltransferase [Chlorobiota bacterium]